MELYTCFGVAPVSKTAGVDETCLRIILGATERRWRRRRTVDMVVVAVDSEEENGVVDGLLSHGQ